MKRLGLGVITAGAILGIAGLSLGGAADTSTALRVASSVSASPSSNSGGNSSGSQGHPFTVTGTFATLYPGMRQYIDLTFVNPNNQSLTIPLNGVMATIKVNSTPSNAQCSSSYFAFVPSTASPSSASAVVPANSTVTVSSNAIPVTSWPAIAMSDTGNQNACQGSTLTLSYSAKATG